MESVGPNYDGEVVTETATSPSRLSLRGVLSVILIVALLFGVKYGVQWYNGYNDRQGVQTQAVATAHYNQILKAMSEGEDYQALARDVPSEIAHLAGDFQKFAVELPNFDALRREFASALRFGALTHIVRVARRCRECAKTLQANVYPDCVLRQCYQQLQYQCEQTFRAPRSVEVVR